MTAAELIAFETRIRAAYLAGELPFLLHLCGGNEAHLIDIFRHTRAGDWVFSTHRSHYHYMCAGGSPERLETFIREGRSMFVFDRALNFLSSSILAGTCAIAAGVAWELQRRSKRPHLRPYCPLARYAEPRHREPWVWCFLGDGAEEQGHFYEAALFVDGHGLPCTFIIEDNDRSVETSVRERRGPFAHLRGLERFDCVHRYRYRPTYPHAGDGDPAVYQTVARPPGF